jgi:hypothetical protein
MSTFPRIAPVVPQPRPANAPRLVNFTGVPEGMGGNQYYGEGLGGIADDRQKLAALAGSDAGLANVHEPFGGAGYVLSKLGNAIRENQAMSAEKATRDTLAGIIGGIDPKTGPTMDQIQAAFQADPAYGTKLYEQLTSMQKQETWDAIPTPQGESGQWFRNSTTGEEKKVGGTSGSGGDNTMELRKEYNLQQPVKDYSTISNAIERIKYGASTGDAPGDMALIFGYMKLLDPTSTVREGEYATVKNAGGVPDWIINTYNNAKDGQILNPDQRTKFVSQAIGQYGVWTKGLQEVNDRYGKIAAATGVDPGLVLVQPREFKLDQPKPKPDDTGDGDGSGDGNVPEDAPPPRPAWATKDDPWPTPEQWGKLSPENKKVFTDWSVATKRPGDF